MCGLFAGVGKLNSNRIVALGSMNEERGTDSVGIAYLEKEEIKIAKIAERPIVGLNMSLRKEVTAAAVSGLFIGHTRQATQGAVTSANAHPFLTDGIAFAHNGIIFNDDAFGKYTVDSESLIHGIKSKDFSAYEGIIALVWIEDGKLHAYRNGNPLYRGKHGGTVYLASDDDYLRAVGCTHVKELAEGMIYTFLSPSQIVTKRVPKNKCYTTSFDKQAWGKADAKSWEEYDAHNLGHSGYLSLEDYDRQMRRSSTPTLADVKALEAKEDFRTYEDERLEIEARRAGEVCAMCSAAAMGDSEYCDLCADWIDKEMMDQDMPLLGHNRKGGSA